MNLVLTNNGGYPTVAASDDGDGWCAELATGIPVGLNNPDVVVVIVGDKPGVTESIIDGIKVVAGAVLAWLSRDKEAVDVTHPEHLNVMIGNNGPNFVRVIMGDGTTDTEVAPGVSFMAQSVGYIEIRELGLVSEYKAEQPEAA
jgi:hypothetical protein